MNIRTIEEKPSVKPVNMDDSDHESSMTPERQFHNSTLQVTQVTLSFYFLQDVTTNAPFYVKHLASCLLGN